MLIELMQSKYSSRYRIVKAFAQAGMHWQQLVAATATTAPLSVTPAFERDDALTHGG